MFRTSRMRAWTAAERLRRTLGGREEPREALVARHARGRSFADVGAMWKVHGAVAFAAEEAGATSVTALDVMPASAEFEAERARRRSAVRFVEGDLHDERVVAELGVHDVVWCSGVVYHAPHPLLTLERLRSITGDTLLLASEVLPERRGLPRACAFAPGPELHPARPMPAGRGADYSPWWWLPSASALRAMLATAGFRVEDERGGRFHRTFVAHVDEA